MTSTLTATIDVVTNSSELPPTALRRFTVRAHTRRDIPRLVRSRLTKHGWTLVQLHKGSTLVAFTAVAKKSSSRKAPVKVSGRSKSPGFGLGPIPASYFVTKTKSL